MAKETVYIALKDKITIDTGEDLSVNDLAKVFCNNKSIKKMVEDLKVYRSTEKENWSYIDSNNIVERVVGYNPNIDVTMIGASEVLLEIKSREEESKVFKFLKIALVLILLFFGSAIAIVNFHEDVNMTKSLEKIYTTFTGEKKSKPLLMTIPYSIGMGLGILGFFNRAISSSERRKKEPGPMEIESYLYDRDMEDYILDDMKNENRNYRSKINDG